MYGVVPYECLNSVVFMVISMVYKPTYTSWKIPVAGIVGWMIHAAAVTRITIPTSLQVHLLSGAIKPVEPKSPNENGGA